MFQTVEEAADHITDVLMEKSADGFMDTVKDLGGKAMNGLGAAGKYMTSHGPNTLHSALGGNDAAHWGALGALGVGGLGAVKGLVAPDEGKGRVRSMLSNAALGALMGGAGGGAAGMTFPGVKNPALGGGSIFSGDREKLDKLQGDVNNANADLDLNRARAVAGPIGAATSALGNGPNTGWGNAALTAGKEIAKPIQESANNLGQSTIAGVGAHNARRAWQLRRLDMGTPGDVKVPSVFSAPSNNPMLDWRGHLGGTAEVERTIDAGSLRDAANRAAAGAKPIPGGAAPAPGLTMPKGVNSLNTANMPNIPAGAAAAAPGGHDIQKVIEELKDVVGGPSSKAGPAGAAPTAGAGLPPGFYDKQYQDLVKTHGNTGAGRTALQDAIDNGKDFKFKTRVPLGGTWKGVAGSQVAGQLIASQLRNLPDSVKRIRQLDSSALSRPEQLIPGVGPGPLGETQIAEKALSDFQNRKQP